MDKTMRGLMISAGLLALPGLLILGKVTRYRHCKRMKGPSESARYKNLRDSKIALDKASSAIQSALEDMERDNSQKDG